MHSTYIHENMNYRVMPVTRIYNGPPAPQPSAKYGVWRAEYVIGPRRSPTGHAYQPTRSFANFSHSHSSPASSNYATRNHQKFVRHFAPPPPNQAELELANKLQRYIIQWDMLRVYGYPVESAHYEGCTEFLRCVPRAYRHSTSSKASSDSGHSSDDSGSPTLELEATNETEKYEHSPSMVKECVRCSRVFCVTESGDYVTRERCAFHWGKSLEVYNGQGYVRQFTCCGAYEGSKGCAENSLHVWSGTVHGINGPFQDYVHTHSGYESRHPPKVYALDCEMSYTGCGLEATKVTMVGYDGKLVYEKFIRPVAEVVDYNTRFSGITEKDLCPRRNPLVKTLPEVQRDLLELIDTDTILVGHALDNDLRALKLVHKTVVDTSVVFPHVNGFPYRQSLKTLARRHLHRDIQCSEAGHNSLEDSCTSLDLMKWKTMMDC